MVVWKECRKEDGKRALLYGYYGKRRLELRRAEDGTGYWMVVHKWREDKWYENGGKKSDTMKMAGRNGVRSCSEFIRSSDSR